MTADGWRCPECGLILAPTVSEHRCDPPSAGVPAAKPDPGKDPDLTAMGVREIRKGVASIDEVRERLGAPPWAGFDPAEPVVFTEQGPVPFSKVPELLRQKAATVNNVTVNVRASGGRLDLTPEQIRQLVAEIQRKLLEQARRNRPGSAA